MAAKNVLGIQREGDQAAFLAAVEKIADATGIENLFADYTFNNSHHIGTPTLDQTVSRDRALRLLAEMLAAALSKLS
jgi:hypothetical protein